MGVTGCAVGVTVIVVAAVWPVLVTEVAMTVTVRGVAIGGNEVGAVKVVGVPLAVDAGDTLPH
jgi:hypothetical protein